MLGLKNILRSDGLTVVPCCVKKQKLFSLTYFRMTEIGYSSSVLVSASEGRFNSASVAFSNCSGWMGSYFFSLCWFPIYFTPDYLKHSSNAKYDPKFPKNNKL